MKKYLKYLWIVCLLIGGFCAAFFWLQKDKVGLTWEESDASTKEAFKDISFGFDIMMGRNMLTVEGKNETLQVSSKKEDEEITNWRDYRISFYAHKDDVRNVTDSDKVSLYDSDEGKGKEGITDTIYASVQIRDFSGEKEKVVEIIRQKIKLKKDIRIFFVLEDDSYGRIESILYDEMNHIEKEYEGSEYEDDILIQDILDTIQGEDSWYYIYGKKQVERAYNSILKNGIWSNRSSIEDVRITPTIYREDKHGKITKYVTLDEKEEAIFGCVDSSSLILLMRKQMQNEFHYELRRYDENGNLVNAKEIPINRAPSFMICKDKALLLYDGLALDIYDAKDFEFLNQIKVDASASLSEYTMSMDHRFISYQNNRLYIIEEGSRYDGKPRIKLSCYDTNGNFYTKDLKVDLPPEYQYPEDYFEGIEMSEYSNSVFSIRFDMYTRSSAGLFDFWIGEQ